MTKIREQVKAIVAGLVAGVGALGTALADSSVTAQEWTTVAVAALVAYQGVYWLKQPVSLASLPALSSDELVELADKAHRREQATR